MPKSPQSKKLLKKKTRKHVPYIRGFKPVTAKQQLQAIGLTNEINEKDSWLSPNKDHFSPIPKCTSVDDWLAQYNEEGQTFDKYLFQCPWLSKRKISYINQKFNRHGTNLREKYPDGVLSILPVGDFSSKTCPDIKALAEFAEYFLALPVNVLPCVPLDTSAQGKIYWQKNGKKQRLKCRFNEETQHMQLNVDPVLQGLPDLMPDEALAMIGVTMTDLYADKSDLFVAGMAAGLSRSAVFSFFRYDANLEFSGEFWYDISTPGCIDETQQKKLLLLRSCRLLVHELGHLLGLAHCIYFSCLMNGSGHLEEDFRQPMFLCPVCLRKLHALCGFDPVERYKNLQGFFNKHDLTDEQKWVEQRLAFIGQQE